MARKGTEIFFKELITNSDQSLYTQMYDSIKTAILNGRLQAGEKLPPTRQIAGFCNISRSTVQTTFNLLLAEGYIHGKPGSGTFVSEQLPEKYLSSTVTSSVTAGFKSQQLPKFSSYGEFVNNSSFKNYYREILPFQAGVPSFADFPFDIWSKIAVKSVKDLSDYTMGYSESGGLLKLRESIAVYLRHSRGVKCNPGQILIVNGSQQALSLVSKIFLDAQSAIIMEDPVYTGAYETFKNSGAEINFIPVDNDGIDVQQIVNSPAKLVYTTPSHQFPLGVSLSLKRRLQLLEWSAKNSAIIIEDDYDSEFRYQVNPLSSLQGLTDNNLVIYIGTFSKVLFPGIRLGYMVLPENLTDLFCKAKAIEDRNSPILEQLILARFMEEGHFGRHLRKMRIIYQERQQILVDAFTKNLSEIGTIHYSPAGLHVVIHLNKDFNDAIIYRQALNKNIVVNPLSLMYTKKRTDLNGLVMGFSAFTPQVLVSGIKKLAEIIL